MVCVDNTYAQPRATGFEPTPFRGQAWGLHPCTISPLADCRFRCFTSRKPVTRPIFAEIRMRSVLHSRDRREPRGSNLNRTHCWAAPYHCAKFQRNDAVTDCVAILWRKNRPNGVPFSPK